MTDILYQNASYYKKEILPYTFILETSKGIIVIKNTEHDFAHLVGKQYSMNLEIQKLDTKRFFMRVLTHKISYENLLSFDKNEYEREYNWIINKNNSFISIFDSFIKNANLKIYKTVGKEIYTKLKMDYFHQDGETITDITILGIIGNSYDNTFLFNTILSNDFDLMNRFNSLKKIAVHKFYKFPNRDLSNKLAEINFEIKSSPNNINEKVQKKKIKVDILSNRSLKKINELLDPSLNVSRGENGKNSIKVIKNGKVIEKGLKLKHKDFKSIQEAAEYINETYK